MQNEDAERLGYAAIRTETPMYEDAAIWSRLK